MRVNNRDGSKVFDTRDPECAADYERQVAALRAKKLGKDAEKIEKFRKAFRGK